MADEQNVTLKQLLDLAARADKRLDDLELGKQNISPLVPITILTTGWETDDTFPKYPKCYDIAIDGLLETDIVAVDTLPGSEEVARAANFMQTQSYAGKVRLRAKNVPTEAIEAQYRIINTAQYAAQEQEAT